MGVKAGRKRKISMRLGSEFFIAAGKYVQESNMPLAWCKSEAESLCPNVRAMKVKVIKVYPKKNAPRNGQEYDD